MLVDAETQTDVRSKGDGFSVDLPATHFKNVNTGTAFIILYNYTFPKEVATPPFQSIAKPVRGPYSPTIFKRFSQRISKTSIQVQRLQYNISP